MDIRGFFGNLLKGGLSIEEIERRRQVIPRLPRIKLEPLHRIAFHLRVPAEALLRVGNISLGGVGFLKDSLQHWPIAGSLIEGDLQVAEEKFPVKMKIVHVSRGVVGCSFVEPAREMVTAIYKHLMTELVATDMVCVAREHLRDEKDGTPHWYHGSSNCELYFVEHAGRIVRFHLVYFGNYLEGGEGQTLRFGFVVDEQNEEKAAYKGAALVRWENSLNAEILSTALRLIHHVPNLPHSQRDAILSLIY